MTIRRTNAHVPKSEMPARLLSTLRAFHSDSGGPAHTEGSGGSGPVKKTVRVLAVDDEPSNIELIESILTAMYRSGPIEVLTTSSPTEVMEILSRERIDILITDTLMPRLNGYQLAPQVRAAYPHIKILAVTATHNASDYPEGSIDGFMQKPLNLRAFISEVERLAATVQ